MLLTDRLADAAEESAAALRAEGHTAAATLLDVTHEADWERALGEAEALWGRPNILVNNAGLAHAAPLPEITLESWRRVFAVNLDGVFLGLKHGIRAMRAGRGGSIVNVASASGVRPSPGAAAYAASKAAVRMLSKTAGLECAAAGDSIRVNAVLPGGVRTPMWEEMPFFQELADREGVEGAWRALAGGTPGGRFASPEEVARVVLFLASDESSYLNASEIAVDYGYTA